MTKKISDNSQDLTVEKFKNFFMLLSGSCFEGSTLEDEMAEISFPDAIETSRFDFDLTNLDRDLFYGNVLAEAIKKAAKDLNSSELHCENLQTAFFYSYTDGDGDENFTIVFADKTNGVYTYLKGYMGEYCDENYDAQGAFSFIFNCSPESIDKMILQEAERVSARIANDVQSQINNLLRNTMPDLKENMGKVFRQQFEEQEFFKPILVAKQQKELLSHIEASEASSKSRTKRKV